MAITTSTSAVSTGTVSTVEDFEALAGDWDDLVRAMPRPEPLPAARLARRVVAPLRRRPGTGGPRRAA